MDHLHSTHPPPAPPNGALRVVIPALNEERFLPATIAALRNQTRPPDRIVIADAGSTDRTAGLARAGGCQVVPGGLPGVGRNRGARNATEEWILFLDADVLVPPGGLEDALRVAARRRLDALSCWFVPDAGNLPFRFSQWLSALYLWLSTRVGWPHSIGGFLLVRRALHEAVGGFDETVLVAEDQDYARRLARAGRYTFARWPRVVISSRRFRAEGFLRASWRWIAIEIHRIFLGEIRQPRFRYFRAGPES